MTLRQAHLIAAAFALFLGSLFVVFSIPIYSARIEVGEGPGAGLFPFWVGIIVVSCALLYLRESLKSRLPGKIFDINSHKTALLECALSIIAYIAVLPYLGFTLSSLLMVFFHLRFIGRCRLLFSLWFSCLTIALLHYFFRVLLYLPLAPGPLGF